jgi:energy-coupling factor transporter ATP-binding protein EcfA2
MIQIDNLNIHLGEFHLRHIQLEIREGEYFVLLGTTGAGKSVLLNVSRVYIHRIPAAFPSTAKVPVAFGIRPEEIAFVSRNNNSKDGNNLKARVIHIRFRSSFLEIELDAGFPLIAYHPWHRGASSPIAEGEDVCIHFQSKAVKVFSSIPL